MRLCFDSFALAKRFVAEPGTRRVIELGASADGITIS
jgi:hypothetical protein